MVDREPDPYQILGIGADATGADIARAWRRVARAMHPDSRPTNPDATIWPDRGSSQGPRSLI
jgi:curved DNA-binding protein CbpA